MGTIYVTEFISLDGVIEAPGGEPGFKYPGWTFQFDRGDDGMAFKVEETMGTDVLLLGRKTYEGFADAWPEREGEFADKFNSMPKRVASSTLRDPAWNNTEVLEGDAVSAVRELRDATDGRIGVHGSGTLARTLIAEDLVDELRLMVFPVVLGTGRKLWGDTDDLRRFTLAESRPVGADGVLTAVYHRV